MVLLIVTNSKLGVRRMKVIWRVDEYLDGGKVRSATFSSLDKAMEAAQKCCDCFHKVVVVEWTYCRPLSVQQVFPTVSGPEIYDSLSMYNFI